MPRNYSVAAAVLLWILASDIEFDGAVLSLRWVRKVGNEKVRDAGEEMPKASPETIVRPGASRRQRNRSFGVARRSLIFRVSIASAFSRFSLRTSLAGCASGAVSLSRVDARSFRTFRSWRTEMSGLRASLFQITSIP